MHACIYTVDTPDFVVGLCCFMQIICSLSGQTESVVFHYSYLHVHSLCDGPKDQCKRHNLFQNTAKAS